MTQNKSFTLQNFSKKNLGGFTLIELLVALAVFSIIMAAVAGIFISGLKAQKLILAKRELLGQTSYLMEYTSRAMRMARKELDAPACLSADGLNYEKTRAGKGIKFKKFDFETLQVICQEFFWDENNKQLYESKNGGTPIPLTSGALLVEEFNIGPDTSWGQGDDFQPRVTFSLNIKTKPEMAKIRIQTTISQRNLDCEQ